MPGPVRLSFLGLISVAVLGFTGAALAAPDKRPSTIADVIGLTLAREPLEHQSQQVFPSPNGASVAAVVNSGDLTTNARDYRLLLFDFAACARDCEPTEVARARALDSRPGISDVAWLDEGRSLVFKGLDNDGRPQVFRFDLERKEIRQLTRAAPGVRAFAISPGAEALAWVEDAPLPPLFKSPAGRGRGLVVTNQPMWSVIAEVDATFPEEVIGRSPPGDLVVLAKGREVRMRLSPKDDFLFAYLPMSVSPDGRHVTVVKRELAVGVPGWEHFTQLTGEPRGGAFMTQWVYSPSEGSSRRLLDAPFWWTSGRVEWTADSRKALLTTYLPASLGGRPPASEQATTAAVDIATGRVERIAEGPNEIADWNPRLGVLTLRRVGGRLGVDVLQKGPPVAYGPARGGEWRTTRTTFGQSPWSASVEEDANTPPRLFVANRTTGLKRMVWDLNPQLAGIALGEVSTIEVSYPGAKEPAKVGLYLPVGYRPGVRYPLVIQTHGWDPSTFQMDGPASAGYAAQALAGRGFVVVQTPNLPVDTGPQEGPVNLAFFDTLVGELDRRGLIDTGRMGVQGWSRTGYGVRYTLQNSRHRYRAAVLADAMSASYLDYLSAENLGGTYQNTLEALNGGFPPFGEGLKSWVERSPGFNNHKVSAAVLLYAFNPQSTITPWEDYVSLRRLGKPVELTYLPDANHWPLRPQERLTVQGGTLDWFCFWLQGYEDPDPAKAEQYGRWRGLRDRPRT